MHKDYGSQQQQQYQGSQPLPPNNTSQSVGGGGGGGGPGGGASAYNLAQHHHSASNVSQHAATGNAPSNQGLWVLTETTALLNPILTRGVVQATLAKTDLLVGEVCILMSFNDDK